VGEYVGAIRPLVQLCVDVWCVGGCQAQPVWGPQEEWTTPGRAWVGAGVEEELGQRACVVCFVGVGVVVLFGGGW